MKKPNAQSFSSSFYPQNTQRQFYIFDLQTLINFGITISMKSTGGLVAE